jgi:hypothetical protein
MAALPEPHPPHRAPPTPAQEFATIVGNMLENSLGPIKDALAHLTDRFSAIEEEFKALRVRQDRLEDHYRLPLFIGLGALALGLIDLGAVAVMLLK